MIGVLFILVVLGFLGFVGYKVIEHSGHIAAIKADIAAIKAKLP